MPPRFGPRITGLRERTMAGTLPGSIVGKWDMIGPWSLEPPASVLVASFQKMALDIRGFRKPLERSVREVLSPSIAKNFIVGGRPTWDELADYTKKRWPRPGDKPLLLTRKTYNTAKALARWEYTDDSTFVNADNWPAKGPGGVDAHYGIYHQYGFDNPWTKSGKASAYDKKIGLGAIPPRPFFVVQPEDVDDIEKIFLDWIQTKVVADNMRWGARSGISAASAIADETGIG